MPLKEDMVKACEDRQAPYVTQHQRSPGVKTSKIQRCKHMTCLQPASWGGNVCTVTSNGKKALTYLEAKEDD